MTTPADQSAEVRALTETLRYPFCAPSPKECADAAAMLLRLLEQRDEAYATMKRWQSCGGCVGTFCKADALQERAERAEAALAKIDAIRNSIIGAQTVNWSEHIYPLVAALDAAGFVGEEYETARKNVGTLIEQIKKAEADNEALRKEVDQLRVQLAGCGVAANSNTHEALVRARECKPGSYGWSASYGDCLKAAEREIAERECAEALRQRVAELERFAGKSLYMSDFKSADDMREQLQAAERELADAEVIIAMRERELAALKRPVEDAEVETAIHNLRFPFMAPSVQETGSAADLLERLHRELTDCKDEYLRVHNEKVDHYMARKDAERELAEARSQLAEARKDAERYRWLRDGGWKAESWPPSKFPTPPWCIRCEVEYSMPTNKHVAGDELDAAIDAEIAKEKP